MQLLSGTNNLHFQYKTEQITQINLSDAVPLWFN